MLLTEIELSRGDFRYIEALLYAQKTHDTAIAELEAQLAEVLDDLLPGSSGSYVDMTAAKCEADSQPEAWTIRRDENIRVKELRTEIAKRKRRRAAVSAARQSLSDDENQFVWLFYDLDKSMRDCGRTMCYEKSKMYRMRQEVVAKVAGFLGLI